MNNQIIATRQLIMNKTKKIQTNAKVNDFLQEVADDYRKYSDYIINEKQQQYNSMKLLQSYLDDLIQTNKLADFELKNAKQDQKELLNEMDKIKLELDKLIQN